MKLNAWLVLVVGSVITTLAIAKLPAAPPLSDEQKAKAAEAKEKAADAAKKEAADLGRYQDKSAERYFRDMKAAGKTVPVATWVPPPPVITPAVAQPSSSESHGQKQSVAPKTQDTANPAAAKGSTNAKPTPAKG
jgi:hypothetical protein